MLLHHQRGFNSIWGHLSSGVQRSALQRTLGSTSWRNQQPRFTLNVPQSTSDQKSESRQEHSVGGTELRNTEPLSVSHPHPAGWLILDLATELKSGSLWHKCEETLVEPPWGISEVIKVMQYGIPLSTSLVAVQLLLAQNSDGPASGAGAAQLLDLREEASRHLGQELLLVGAAFLLLWAALGATQPRSKGMFRFSLSPQSAISVALICLLLFPAVDPLISSSWTHAVREATCWANPADALCSSQGGAALGLNPLALPTFAADSLAGPVPGSIAPVAAAVSTARPFKDTLLGCVQGGDYVALSMHLAASCLLGPLWEETFWRGFILPSMASKLPGQLPLAVLCSSLNFATLHLSIASGLPIFILSSVCDVLYLRSGSIAPPLLLHAAWNAYQLLGVAFFGKEAFV